MGAGGRHHPPYAGALPDTNLIFRELRHGEVRRIHLPRGWMRTNCGAARYKRATTHYCKAFAIIWDMDKARAKRLAKDRRQKIVVAQRRAIEGPLPDFVVLGTQKGGTSFFYTLLTEHPLVRRAAAKELHFFDNKFAEGVGWYRRCFSEGEQVDGHRTITGEASPSYLFEQQVPERMAQIVPEARLIALLRNPVDRAYSHYQMEVRRGKEARSFEDATQEEMTSAKGEGNTV